MTAKAERSKAEDFLELVERSKRGRLKLYLGFAAGVGKTYRMLEEARALYARHTDVVLAYVETHGRLETEALVGGLPIVPRLRVEYRQVLVEEMDLPAVLARKPAVAIVDEIPHSNLPSSKNRKRYQDVIELLDAGINVIGAMNIQHLESLNDLVHRVTGVVVRETVPDSFVQHADQIVNVDLAVEDLLERLQAGKIYNAERARGALDHFFKSENLGTLRELALREVAENVERLQGAGIAGRAQAQVNVDRGRIMVCMSSYPPSANLLLRRGSRAAGRLNTDWFVVYVETPHEAPHRIDAEAQRHLLANIATARELGAEVVRIKGEDPVSTIIDFARAHDVGLIVIGRSHQPWWRQMLGRSVPLRLVKEAHGIDLHIVAMPAQVSPR